MSTLATAIGSAEKLNGISDAVSETQDLVKAAEFLKKDAEFLEGLPELKSPELTEKITEHLVQEGRPGSAEYIAVFSKSTVLDKQFEMVKSHSFDEAKAAQEGIPVMIDTKQTTPDMLENGEAVLTADARQDMLGAANALKYKLDQHITKTTQQAAEYYATEFTSQKGALSSLASRSSEATDIPFSPNEAEMARLKELSEMNYTSRDEAQQAFKRELIQMMKNRPESIGLNGTVATARHMMEISETLGGKMDSAVKVESLTGLHDYLKGDGMTELQIHPGFADAIEQTTETDLTALKVAPIQVETISTVEPSHDNTEWLASDINENTRRWFINSENGNLSGGYNPQEQETANLVSQDMFSEAQKRAGQVPPQGEVNPLDALKAVQEKDDEQEALKLMIRIAVKVSAKAAIIIARNMAKDKDTPQELRVALGMFADVTEQGSRFADKLISGDQKPDLEKDCIAFFKSTFGTQETA